jgi:hypothetical protein
LHRLAMSVPPYVVFRGMKKQGKTSAGFADMVYLLKAPLKNISSLSLNVI